MELRWRHTKKCGCTAADVFFLIALYWFLKEQHRDR
jgi:hypothetical protein